ncbi:MULTISPECIES: hypothetical protein [Burkholderia cepacia complex]|uniref:hypothetical protein n=1 Tax=Burkholderia cepacia complex TaxID=87882 RepID=UPI0012DAD7C7|nr:MULTISPECIES: hypothetical protein [Burkholderia cepacia complex]MCA8014638.1 hypothetical protein [Burkholderia vietnamiensis]MDN7412646.1 hypothetical protein [Burkholderia vietnamiensis]UEC01223.1 hypothetical protein LK462_21925 [Burkholderia vietnamiensis]HDR8930295.1 hypothetical protein [Burkholderia vietnamiensis]
MAINIYFRYTDRAQKTINEPGGNPEFLTSPTDPFPNTGDVVDFELSTGPRAFVVVGRQFVYRKDASALHVYLDLPPEEKDGDFNPELWTKLGE